MFFRREKRREITFDERLENVRHFGFETQRLADGRVKVSRDGIAAVIEEVPGQLPRVSRAGLLFSDEIGLLVHGGFQQFWQTQSGQRRPALAPHLKALHRFEEDLKEGLGLVSLYNESLGTTSDLHLYDRVEDRDRGVPTRPWQR